ncbi:MAG: hypothetical protein AAGL49_09610, partial [Pseudomonadota bacterium]
LWRIVSLILESAVLSLGRAGVVLAAKAASAVLNVAILAVLLPNQGVIGAPIAIIASWLVLVLACGVPLWMRPPEADQRPGGA